MTKLAREVKILGMKAVSFLSVVNSKHKDPWARKAWQPEK
jgi:hypothetical protein